MGVFDKFFKKKDQKKEDKGRASSPSLKENLNYIKEKLKDCDDVIYRDLWVGENQEFNLAVVFIDGLIDKALVNDHVIHSLLLDSRQADPSIEKIKGNLYEVIKKGTISGGDIKEVNDLDKCIL